MENLSLRQRAKSAGIPLWKIASCIGISEPTITRWLRVPLSCSKEKLIVASTTCKSFSSSEFSIALIRFLQLLSVFLDG